MTAIYRGVIKSLDKLVPQKFQPFWNHPAGDFLDLLRFYKLPLIYENHNNFLHFSGPKTVFFWAPTVKWVRSTQM